MELTLRVAISKRDPGRKAETAIKSKKKNLPTTKALSQSPNVVCQMYQYLVRRDDHQISGSCRILVHRTGRPSPHQPEVASIRAQERVKSAEDYPREQRGDPVSALAGVTLLV